MLEKIKKIVEDSKQDVLKHRFGTLFVGATVGIALAYLFAFIFGSDTRTLSSVILLILVLPNLTLLWVFKTHDT